MQEFLERLVLHATREVSVYLYNFVEGLFYLFYGGSEVTCRKPDTFLLAATFAAINFAVSLFLLRLLLRV